MSDVSQVKDATRPQDVESLIAAIGRTHLLDCVILSGTSWPEVSGVLSAEDGEMYREVIPLGDGVHIVLSVGLLPTKLVAGIHED